MRTVMIMIGCPGVVDAGAGWAALESAQTPSLDRMGGHGRVGAVALGPGGAAVSDGRGLLTLLGVPGPAVALASDAVLEAASGGVDGLGEAWVARLGLVGVSGEDDEGVLLGRAGVSADEAAALLGDLVAHWTAEFPEFMAGVDVIGTGIGTGIGAGAERLLIDRAGAGYAGVETAGPDGGDAVGEPWVEHLPDGGSGPGAERLCALIGSSRGLLAGHPVNAARREAGLGSADLAWLWEPGTAAGVRTPEELGGSGVRVLSGDAGVLGAARLLGAAADPVDVSGDDAHRALAERVLSADESVVVAHATAPEPGAVGEIDRGLIGPVLAGLERAGGGLETGEAGWRLLVVLTGDWGEGLSPFALAGGWVRNVVPRRLHLAHESDLLVDPGCELLEYVLRAGLRGR